MNLPPPITKYPIPISPISTVIAPRPHRRCLPVCITCIYPTLLLTRRRIHILILPAPYLSFIHNGRLRAPLTKCKLNTHAERGNACCHGVNNYYHGCGSLQIPCWEYVEARRVGRWSTRTRRLGLLHAPSRPLIGAPGLHSAPGVSREAQASDDAQGASSARAPCVPALPRSDYCVDDSMCGGAPTCE